MKRLARLRRDVVVRLERAPRPEKETMTGSRFVFVLGCVAFATGCAALHHLDDYTTADRATAGEEPSSPSPEAPGEPAPETRPRACRANSDCGGSVTAGDRALDRVSVPSICVKATGTCAPLVTPECPRFVGDYASDEAVVIGTVLGTGSDGSSLERAARLAAEEIQAAASGALPPFGGQGRPRPVVLLSCDASGNVLQAARHLARDLRVPAVVGPTRAEDVVELTQQVTAEAGTLLMTPAVLASSISDLPDNDLTWRGVPSDNQRAKLVIEQLKELESVLRATRGLTTVKLGVVHRSDALGLSARDSIRDKLILNGRFVTDAANADNVSLDAYDPADAAAQEAVVTKYAAAFRPDLVFLTAPEQVSTLLVPLEKALTAARVVQRPYYVCTDALKTDALLEALASSDVPADIRRRVRGVGLRPDAESAPVLADFRAAYATRYGEPPDPAAAAAYDATAAIVLALASRPERPVTGAGVARGLRALGVGTPLSVGARDAARALDALATGRAISLRGTHGLLRWDARGDIAGGSLEVWCVGGPAGAPAFGSSGLTMDVQTQVVGGGFVQCQ